MEIDLFDTEEEYATCSLYDELRNHDIPMGPTQNRPQM